jgi:two-component system, NtrC family, sensor kinase
MSPTPDRTLDDLQQTIADLKRQLAESNAERDHLRSERDEALEQQTATTEVLQVINSSPGDLAPVFEAMLEKAMRLCRIDHGAFHTYDGQLFRAFAVRGLPEPLAERLRQGFRLGPNHPMRPVLDGAPFVHIPDLTKVDQSEVLLAVEYGSRTLLFIPLRKGDALIGQIVVAPSPTRRSRCCRTSPRKRSSRWRTRAC